MEPFPVYPRGKSRDVVSGKTGSGKKFYHTLSEQQLVVCGKVDSACNDEFMDNAFAFCREKWPMHGGQLQLHHNKGQLQGFELQCGRRPGSVTGYKDVSTVGERTLMSAVARQPVSIAIKAHQSSFQSHEGADLCC